MKCTAADMRGSVAPMPARGLRLRLVALALIGGLGSAVGQPVLAQAMASLPVMTLRDSTASAYRLRPGDVLRLRIWREPELSGEFPVDESGRVNFPLVGTFVVTSESRESLNAKLVAAYSNSLKNLSMDVIFLRRIAVLGALRTPGLIVVEPTMTVGDALALAGGPTVDAAHTRITLMRSGQVFMDNLDPSMLIAQLPIARGDQIYVPPRDGFLVRNPWFIGTMVQAGVAIIATAVTLIAR